MTLTYKLFSGLAAVCALGLIWTLAEIVAPSPDSATRAASVATSAPHPLSAANPAASATPAAAPNWIFTLRADAEDNPATARSTSASIVFEGTVTACNDPYPRTQFGLGVDRTGAQAAHARREQRVCVPGCTGEAPTAVTRSLERHLDLTAFQEQFDRALGEYAPQGRLASVEWECNGTASRLVAASVVALACNSESCDDKQVANASVYMAYEHGRRLDEVSALFALRGLGAGPVVGRVSSQAAPR